MIKEYNKNNIVTCSCGHVHDGVAGDYMVNRLGVVEEHECENCYTLFQVELTPDGTVAFMEGE